MYKRTKHTCNILVTGFKYLLKTFIHTDTGLKYHFGKISNITPRNLDDTGSGDTLVLGLKSQYKLKVKEGQASLLAQTDWAVVRKADTDKAIPSNIATWRAAIRTKATEMENAIDGASDIDAFIALFLVWDGDGNKSGILYDWPVLEE